ncbi:MAG: protein kinase, partial [Pirellulales bacterium]|nr:protein kinase [Pirellulales bacterium]
MFKAKQQLGKYRIQRRVNGGPFADVYAATDTIEGVSVALKIPQARLMTKEFLEDFRKEVRVMARLDHPHILPLKDASFIGSHFVIAFPLGQRTLADRMRYRLSLPLILDYADQMVGAVAHAHANRVIHCDIKPENFILFPGNHLRLTDFGIAKVARRTIQASGSGTVGYVAPEQAMGRPSFCSDVFSLGLVLYQMLSGQLPEWPYAWPPPGFARLRGRVHPDLINVVRRALEVDPRRRFHDAARMHAALKRVKPRALCAGARLQKRSAGSATKRDWKTIRRRQFLKQYGAALGTRFSCPRCGGPVSEPMHACPWCGAARRVHRHQTRFP